MSDREGQYNKPSKLNAPKPGLEGESGTQQNVRRSKIADVADTVADYVGPTIDSMKSALGVDTSGGNPGEVLCFLLQNPAKNRPFSRLNLTEVFSRISS